MGFSVLAHKCLAEYTNIAHCNSELGASFRLYHSMPTVKQLVHVGFDLVLVSVILAGLRRNTGLVLAYETSDLKNYIRKYLNWGEYIFDKLIAFSKDSQYFRKESKLDGFLSGMFKRIDDDQRKDPLPAHLD